MSDYTKGSILSAATALPATTATGMMLTNSSHTWVVWALIAVSAISFLVTSTTIVRYMINRRRAN